MKHLSDWVTVKLVTRTSRRLVTTFATTVVVAVLATAWAVASPLSAQCAAAEVPANISPAPTETAGFVDAINQLRVSKGLNALIIDSNLTDIAQGWAQQMAENDAISHRIDLTAGITSLWKTIGENVGVGPDVQSLMSAFIASPGHYKNLVDPRFTHVGVGSVRTTSGVLYTAHEFMALQSDSAGSVVTSPPPTSPPATRAPRAIAPVVTAPPTTVTTMAPTTTTLLVLPTEQHKLNHSSQNNQQQQNNKSQGRCRSHTSTTLMALAPVAGSR
jgi:uncharacterized protein YkwD